MCMSHPAIHCGTCSAEYLLVYCSSPLLLHKSLLQKLKENASQSSFMLGRRLESILTTSIYELGLQGGDSTEAVHRRSDHDA